VIAMAEVIDKFIDFFDKNLTDRISNADKFLDVTFSELSQWDLDLADELLNNPEDTIKAAELAVSGLSAAEGKQLSVRFSQLPSIQTKNIWQTRKEDVGKFMALKGIINKASSIIPVCVEAKFECPTCGNVTKVLQISSIFKEPAKCGCGRKGKMTLIDKVMADTIKLGLIDDLMDVENVDRAVAREALAILSSKQCLTSHDIDRLIKPGKKVVVNGYFEYIQKGPSTEFNTIFKVNSIEFVKVGWDTVKVPKNDKAQIKKLAAQHDIISRLAESIADVKGYPEVKIACLLLLAGAPHMKDNNKHLTSRSTIHILLIGNPGSSKTYLIKRAGAISPIYSFQAANTSSGKGLVASVVNDKEVGGWIITPGVVALASKGVCIAGTQKIMTNKGLLYLQDVVVGDQVLSHNTDRNQNEKVTHIFDNGVKDTVLVKLYTGEIIHCTPNHRIMTNVGWKQAGELTNKDFVKNYYIKRTGLNYDEVERGWLFGFALSDIWYNTFIKKGSRNCIKNVMSYSSSIKNLTRAEYAKRLLHQQGIKRINVSKKKGVAHIIGSKNARCKDSISYRFSDKRFHKEVKEMFEENKLPFSSNGFYLGFLAGILDTDASICHKKGKYGIKHEIVVTVTRHHKPSQTKEWNGNILTLVNSLFHRFGIMSCIRGDKISISSLRSYNLCVTLFKRHMVGKNKTKLYLVKPKKKISSYDDLMDDKYFQWFKSIKFNTGKTVKLGLHSSIWTSIKRGNISARLVWSLYKHWNQITNEDFIPPIKDYVLNKVMSVSQGEKTKVYDLTVPHNNNFMLPGGLVHNCAVDEIDKTHKDDYGDHNHAMNDMEVRVSKANVKARLETETSYLATANPEHRVFTAYEDYINQIAMPKDFLDRFDIIFPMTSPSDPESKEGIMDIMLERHLPEEKRTLWKPEFTHEFIRKYIAYCRSVNSEPKMSSKLFPIIKQKLNELMKPKNEEQARISFRQLESIMRFAYASARLRLRDVTEEDIDLAVSLKRKSFIELGIIDKSGTFDWAREEHVSEEKISDSETIHNVLQQLLPDKEAMVEWQQIVQECVKKGVSEEKVDEYINKKKQMGDLIEPRRAFLRRM
jgi:DNA replicative helicase MCM subunit Mcm2 (Cdc46/Mcm family)